MASQVEKFNRMGGLIAACMGALGFYQADHEDSIQ